MDTIAPYGGRLDDPCAPPQAPEIGLTTEQLSLIENAQPSVALLVERGFLPK
jgi:hypothetical protein